MSIRISYPALKAPSVKRRCNLLYLRQYPVRKFMCVYLNQYCVYRRRCQSLFTIAAFLWLACDLMLKPF